MKVLNAGNRIAALAVSLFVLSMATGCAWKSAGVTALGSSGPLKKQLDPLFGDPRFASALWGARVETLDGKVLYDLNGSKSFTPASNLKVFTTAAALDLLGPTYTYKTRVKAVGRIDAQGELKGDLVIVGSGDPSLGSWHLTDESNDSRELLRQWVAKTKEAGIRRVAGNIVGDGRIFTEEYICGGWETEDVPYWYAAGSSGLAMEENGFRFVSAPGRNVGDPATITLIPDTKYITVINATKTGRAESETTLDIVYRAVEGNEVRFARSIALDKKPFQQRGSVWDGPRYAAFLFKEALEREGIEVDGEALNIRALPAPELLDSAPMEENRVIATYTSPPMSRLVAVVNKPSHNFFADQILRTLAVERRKEGSFAGGAEVIKEWLETIGASDADSFQMVDGSGLARRNLVQPRQLCAVLRSMYAQDALRFYFYESLPIAGVDGGLEERMTWESTRGNVHAKTGYIGAVRSLSGYVTDPRGQILIFSMMVNQNRNAVSDADRIIDEACRVLAER